MFDWKVLERRVERLRPYEIFSRDEWLRLHEDCFDTWRIDVLPGLQVGCRPPQVEDGDSIIVDFSAHLWQVIGLEFERAWLFQAIARRHAEVYAVAAAKIVEPAVIRVSKRLDNARSDVNRYSLWGAIDILSEWMLTGAYLGRMLIGTVRAIFLPRLQIGRRLYLWRGISPREIPDKAGRVDFAWAAHGAQLDASNLVYFLPTRLTVPQRKYLHQSEIVAVEPLDEFRILGRRALLDNSIRSLRCIKVAAGWRRGLEGAWLARLAVRALIWGKIAETVGARWYITTTSSSWPEQAELAVLKQRGVRSITWAYSANSLTFAWHNEGFRDVGVERSLLTTDEFWVWNEAFRQWLEGRRCGATSSKQQIRVVGALMCGDSRLMRIRVEKARQLLGLPSGQWIVGVFDMPAISVQWKQRFGGGPSMIEFEYYAAFLHGILQVLKELPDIAVLLKLKREVGDWTREFPEELQELLMLANESSAGNGRVHLIDVDVDPYLPIACSDMTIGMPYTSPVLAGLAMGKPGCYYDPTGIANYPSEPALRLITLQTPDALVDAVRRRGASLARGGPLARITPPIPDPLLLRKLENV